MIDIYIHYLWLVVNYYTNYINKEQIELYQEFFLLIYINEKLQKLLLYVNVYTDKEIFIK